jgi:hypothetical protein
MHIPHYKEYLLDKKGHITIYKDGSERYSLGYEFTPALTGSQMISFRNRIIKKFPPSLNWESFEEAKKVFKEVKTQAESYLKGLK